jgi:predicted RNA-binding protein with PIN domain
MHRGDDLDVARASLVADVAAFAKGDLTATVVFDAAANPDSDGSFHSIAGVDVVFSAYGRDADSVIEQTTGAHRRAGDDVTVVTSDAETQWVVMGQGATRMSSPEFVAALGEMDEDLGEHTPQGSGRGTIEDRLDDETRRRLRRWAEGKQ